MTGPLKPRFAITVHLFRVAQETETEVGDGHVAVLANEDVVQVEISGDPSSQGVNYLTEVLGFNAVYFIFIRKYVKQTSRAM